MIGKSPILGSDQTVPAGPPPTPQLPAGFVELTELHSVSIDRKLGYFRDERFVLFGYCPAGAEVIWKDGHSSGFGTGGWWTFLEEIAPLADRRGHSLGSATSAGTHVLLVDRLVARSMWPSGNRRRVFCRASTDNRHPRGGVFAR